MLMKGEKQHTLPQCLHPSISIYLKNLASPWLGVMGLRGAAGWRGPGKVGMERVDL